MATFGIDGLASGLDTTGIINQLMQIEQQPQVRLRQKVSRADAAIASLQKFSTAFDKLKDLAAKLSGAKETFLPTKASSSSDTVAATATSDATPGSLTFTVDRLATTHRVVSENTTANLTDTVATADSTVRITVDGTDYDVATGDGSLSTLVANINATAGLEVKAQAVNTGNGYKLQLNATESGASGAFTVDATNMTPAFAGTMPVLAQGQDARILVGEGPGQYEVTSSSNTFNEVVAGLSFTVSEADPNSAITVTIDHDPDALIDQVKDMVDAVNAALTGLKQATDSGKDGKQGSLSNDPTMRSLRDRLVSAVSFAVEGSYYQSAGLIGIETTREGGIKFDETKFRDALADRPDDVVAMFRSDDPDNPGIAQRLETLATDATALNTGIFASAIESRETNKRSLEDQISAMDVRLELKRSSLQRQFAALETALSGMQAQGQWLSSQLGSLQANAPRR